MSGIENCEYAVMRLCVCVLMHHRCEGDVDVQMYLI